MTDAHIAEVSELARLLSKPNHGNLSLHQGVVAGFGRGTIQVMWQGGDLIEDSEVFPVGGIRFLNGYFPKLGDVVWAIGNDGDRLVLGKITPANDILPEVQTIGVDDAPAFLNGWTNHGGTYGPARYWVDSDGWLHMAGFVAGGTATQPMFELPAGSRPYSSRRIPVVCRSGATGHRAWGLVVQATGLVFLENKTPPGDLNLGVSLNGVRFQVEDTLPPHARSHEWTPFVLGDAWTWDVSHNAFDFPAVWQRWDGLVRTRGHVVGLGSELIGTPPERACRRRYSGLFVTVNDSGSAFQTRRLDLRTFSRALVSAGNPGGEDTTLDGLQWLSDLPESDLSALKLETGWSAYSPEGQWGAPAYFLDGHSHVHVQGLVTGGTTTNGTPVGWLPEGHRPPYREAYMGAQGTGGISSVCRLDVDPADGFIYLMTSSAVNNYLTLDHVSFSTEL
jgi:hypothetical protein